MRNGSQLVLIVDPIERSVEVHEAGAVRTLAEHDVIRPTAFPELVLDFGAIFSVLDEGTP